MAKTDLTDLEKFLAMYPAESREVALDLREWVWDLYPSCNELIYDNYNFLAFGWAPTDRMGDIFCSIAVGTRGVMFGFMHGVELDDPDSMLSGSGSKFRSLRVPDMKTFPRGYVRRLMKQAYANSVAGLKGRTQTSTGATIVKSVSPTKRRPGVNADPALAKRERHPMPDFVLSALKKAKLLDAYEMRPPYQQNDYVGWIAGARQTATQQKRLDHMLDELRRGDVYMKMTYTPKRQNK